MLTLLKNVNYEVSYNDKDEVESMMYAVPKLSNYVTHYTSHRLCSNVQFYAIEKYSVNENISIHCLYGYRPQAEGFLDKVS